MTPIEFHECNVVFAKDQPEFLPLPALKEPDGKVTSCWELTPEEIVIINRTGKLFISQLTFNNPLQAILPFVKEAEE